MSIHLLLRRVLVIRSNGVLQVRVRSPARRCTATVGADHLPASTARIHSESVAMRSAILHGPTRLSQWRSKSLQCARGPVVTIFINSLSGAVYDAVCHTDRTLANVGVVRLENTIGAAPVAGRKQPALQTRCNKWVEQPNCCQDMELALVYWPQLLSI
jgi:hypothetical protein